MVESHVSPLSITRSLAAAVCLLSLPALALDDAAIERGLEMAQRRLARTAATLPDPTYFPRSTLPDGSWKTVRNTDNIEWTQGFFPGCLWMLYDLTGEPYWRARAEAWTGTLEVQKSNRETHDLGFKLMPSYGLDFRLTPDASAQATQAVLLTAADSLASRYNALVGVIDTADWNPDWDVPTVVDTMMNLELLLWASEAGNRPELKAMAVSHALKSYQDMVRPDGGTFHVVDYNHTTGAIRSRKTFQGYADSSTWSRGQAWAIYGFTVVYRYTRSTTMLEAAQKTANYYLDHLPADFIPNWDFQAPTQKKDSSAAAATASALLELSGFVTDSAVSTRYRDAALKTLESLTSPGYLNAGASSPAILLHGVGHLPANQEIDVGLIYGDYYFLEALLRLNPKPNPAWYSRLDVSMGLRTLNSVEGKGERLEATFDLTPLGGFGGELGYADGAAQVISVQNTAIRLRLTDSGSFEALNGDRYQAAEPLSFAPNITYRARVRVDTNGKRYSLWIAPPAGQEVQIAQSYAFGTGDSTPALSSLGRLLLKAGGSDGDYKIANHRVEGKSEDEPLEDWMDGLTPGGSGLGGGGCGSAPRGGDPWSWLAALAGLTALVRARGEADP